VYFSALSLIKFTRCERILKVEASDPHVIKEGGKFQIEAVITDVDNDNITDYYYHQSGTADFDKALNIF
jgi:hypothetical protein